MYFFFILKCLCSCLISVFLCFNSIFAQTDSLTQKASTNRTNSKRLKTFTYIAGSGYVISMTGLYFLWYDKNSTSQFRFFDDSHEWKQVDKIGHFYSAFHISQISAEAFTWAGLSKRKASLWGLLAGIALMTPIEIFDGFSPKYGASVSDFVANILGSLCFWGQKLAWNEVRIQPKFSFSPTPFAPQRPQLLGRGLHQEWLKDYNGQTYWLSLDLDKFWKHNRYVPKWLHIAIGYGASNMLFARDEQNIAIGLTPYRQWYIGLDWDLSAIRTQNRFFKQVFKHLRLIRLPAPAFSFSPLEGLKAHLFYF
ncbi:MAG: YfiM family protein [Microscillaceae bacterium]|nr:YfiM family protein [Microscillaceae bacterium]MDW8461909.1 DUF2279 domain-containing protein [Cytophagales bacterium]